MKTLILFISFVFSLKIQAQSTIQTATISVKGNCEECKERIENAADIKGVKNCVWTEAKKMAVITYDANKVTLEQIEKAIAMSGHETARQKADPKAYKVLPECCKYKDSDCKKK